MRKIVLSLGLALLFSAFMISPVQATVWSTPIPIATPWMYPNNAPAVSADGGKFVFSGKVGETTEIFIINSDGTGMKQLTNNAVMDGYPSISGDGSKIAFLSFKLVQLGGGEPLPMDYQLCVINSDGTGLKTLTNSTIESGIPSISGDGGKVAFCSLRPGALFIANSDGTGLKKLTNGTNDLRPSISGDGSKIAFLSKVYDGSPGVDTNDPYSDEYELLLINSDGTELKQLTFNLWINWFDTSPSISSDSNKIAFSNGPLFVVNSDGTELKQLTINQTGRVFFPSISGDGSKIVYSWQPLTYGIYGELNKTVTLSNTDGEELANLGSWSTASSTIPGQPSISRNGSIIAIPLNNAILFSFSSDIQVPGPLQTTTANPTPTPTPSPSPSGSEPTPTPTVPELSWLVIVPFLIAVLPFTFVKLFRKRR